MSSGLPTTATGAEHARAHVAAFEHWRHDPALSGREAQLADLAELREAVELQIRRAVYAARTKDEPRVTWRAIGDALGVSMQAAEQRYGPIARGESRRGGNPTPTD